jgi:hypothetical protein
MTRHGIDSLQIFSWTSIGNELRVPYACGLSNANVVTQPTKRVMNDSKMDILRLKAQNKLAGYFEVGEAIVGMRIQ